MHKHSDAGGIEFIKSVKDVQTHLAIKDKPFVLRGHSMSDYICFCRKASIMQAYLNQKDLCHTYADNYMKY